MKSQPALSWIILASVVTTGCIDTLGADLIEQEEDPFSTLHLPPEEHGPGSVAYLIELGDEPKKILHNWHQYQRGGWGSSPDHAGNFLVPLHAVDSPYDLKPTDLSQRTNRLEWNHSYRADPFHGTAHMLAFQHDEESLYLNPNDDNPPQWTPVDPPANYFGTGKPLQEGLYWWVFTSNRPHMIEAQITNSRLVEGPVMLPPPHMKAFTSNGFKTQSTISTHPVPGVGAYHTSGATATVAVDGPSYAFAQAIHHDQTPPDFGLLGPDGEPIEMRQKIEAAEGIFIGGNGLVVGVGANLTVPQADVLHPDAGQWQAFVGEGTGSRFEFILYVQDLTGLPD